MNDTSRDSRDNKQHHDDVIRDIPKFANAIVVDVNNVFKERESIALLYLDKFKLMRYTARGRNPFDLRGKLETLLEELDATQEKKILTQWMTGQCSRLETKKQIISFIECKLSEKKNSTTLHLLREILDIMLTPDILTKVLVLNESIVKKLSFLQSHHNHKIYLAGNIDHETYALLKRKHPDFFLSIDGEHLSFQCGHVKPQKEFFHSLFDKLAVNPFKTCFIDDLWYDSLTRTGLHIIKEQDV